MKKVSIISNVSKTYLKVQANHFMLPNLQEPLIKTRIVSIIKKGLPTFSILLLARFFIFI